MSQDLWVLYDGDATMGTCKVVSDEAGTATLTVDATTIGALSTTGDVLFTLGSTEAFTLTCSDISAPVVMTNTMTTAGKTGCRALFNVKANVALGSYCNAVKGYMEFTGTSGSTTGLASGVCAELKTPNRTLPGGAYYPLEVEYVAGGTSVTSNGSTTRVGFLYMQNSTDLNGDFDDNGYLLTAAGLTSGASHLLSAQSITLRCQVGLTMAESTRYLVMSSAENCLTLATTGGTSISVGACTTALLVNGATTNAISITGAPATAAVNISGAEAVGVSINTSTPTNGIDIAAACANAIAISGANTTAAIAISGDQVIGLLYDVDDNATDGLKMSVDTAKTLTEGIEMSGAGTITTGIMFNPAAATTGISISGTACGTGITISAGSMTDGIKISGATPVDGIEISSACSANGINISGACVDGIEIAAACTTTGINISGDCVTGIAIGAQTTAGITIGNTGIGIEMNGTYNNCLRLTNALSTSAQTTVRVLDTYSGTSGYHTAVMGASLLVPAGGTGTGAAIGVYGEANIQGECTGTNWSFGVRGTLQLTNATVLNGASSIFGAINASMKDDATPTLTTGHVCGIYIENLIDADLSGKAGISAMIYSANNASATCTINHGWYNYGPGITNLLGLYDCTVGGCVSAGGTIGTHGTSTVKIAIDIDGTTYYLLASTVPTFT